MKDRIISVIGSGNGGQTVAGHLALNGFKVNLFEHPKFEKNLTKIKNRGGIELVGKINGFGKLNLVTSNIEDAIRDSNYVLFIVPTIAQVEMFRLALPYLITSQVIVLIPGNFGSLVLRKMLENNDKKMTIVETNTLPYACRKIEEGKVNIWGVKTFLSMATLPSNQSQNILREMGYFFPIKLNLFKNVLEAGFSNPNMIVHCPTMVLNTGRIESTNGNFRFYTEGMTQSVCSVMEEIDRERIEVGKRLDLDLISTLQWLKETYRVDGTDLYQVISNNPTYSEHGFDAPKSMNHRYLTEDVPHLLVPIACFAKLFKIKTSMIDCIIQLASSINKSNYIKIGRNLNALGISGKRKESILMTL